MKVIAVMLTVLPVCSYAFVRGDDLRVTHNGTSYTCQAVRTSSPPENFIDYSPKPTKHPMPFVAPKVGVELLPVRSLKREKE
jgi:hypothetical protein